MSVNYKHSCTQKAAIPYSFTCEFCRKDSGKLYAEISETKVRVSAQKTLPPNEMQELVDGADARLTKSIENIQKEAEAKEYSMEFKNICPHCKSKQSWALSRVESEKYAFAIGFGIIGIIMGIISYAVTKSLLFAAIFTIVPIISGIGLGIIRVINFKNSANSVENKELPFIEWETTIRQNAFDISQ